MRMWCINTNLMCRQHLLGEHLEIHMFVNSILENKNLKGFINNGLLEIHSLRKRHKEIIDEFKRRGYKHKSPLPYFKKIKLGYINRSKNFQVLFTRCKDCRDIMLNIRKGQNEKENS